MENKYLGKKVYYILGMCPTTFSNVKGLGL
jgi:hypothetical protein